MKYLIIATQLKHLEALVVADSEDEACARFLEGCDTTIASYDEPIIDEVVEVK